MISSSKKTLEISIHDVGGPYIVECIDQDHYKQMLSILADGMFNGAGSLPFSEFEIYDGDDDE